ncbi:hypothetical protein WJX72_010142 [[Myrmecia] bisecta]|uniref:mannan endo-1,4-beta-mannosidase n=1 Tax=[Myrmecia] bisecta TaxID=41462 RepID=A0AAW1QSK4_9CHLO
MSHGSSGYAGFCGVYNETVFRAFDEVLATAASADIKLIITFIDYWRDTDGIPQCVRWCNGGTDKPTFYSDASCKQMYKDHVQTVLNRLNTVTGVSYKNDPAVFAWDLVNEPRCDLPGEIGDSPAPASCIANLQSWIDEMAAYVKGIDGNHLLTIGEEGLFGQSDSSANPPYVQNSGQDFLANHRSSNIDFATVHIWPDNWQLSPPLPVDFVSNFLQAHIQAAQQLGKPLLLEEFGKSITNDNDNLRSSVRDPYFRAAYQAVQDSLSNSQPLKAAMFWELDVRGQGDASAFRPFGISTWDSTWTLVKNHVAWLVQHSPSCSSRTTISVAG